MHIEVKQGLDIPIEGAPTGPLQSLVNSDGSHPEPKEYSLNLSPFEQTRFKLLKKIGETVKQGEPLALDKSCTGRLFVAPISGVVKAVERGLKRKILNIVIEADASIAAHHHNPIDPSSSSRDAIVSRLMEGGLFNRLTQRPFGLMADPQAEPRSIFVRAVESAPFTPSAEMQVSGYEEAFQVGLDTLAALTSRLHLVARSGTFNEYRNVTYHTVEGPHPAGNSSVHIEAIDPINSVEDVVWTIDAQDVVAIGILMAEGRYHNSRVIAIAGNGLIDDQQAGFFRITEGIPVAALIAGRIPKGAIRLISGNPLMGRQVTAKEYLCYGDTVFCAIPESVDRELLHFFRLGLRKYTFSRAYMSGHLKEGLYPFTTNQHGEHRPFIDNSLYDQVTPLNIPTMQLVKAMMAEDYDLAEQLGIFEVVPEDFALAAFVCPSKMEMVEIMKKGINSFAQEMLE